MTTTARLTFFLDVDNTLLDNDGLKAAGDRRIRQIVGHRLAERFWIIYEDMRTESGVVDYRATFARFREDLPDDERVAEMERAIYQAPFAQFVFPGALEAIADLWTVGTAAILSDGDAVYQPLKIERSGLARAVRGNVLVYDHKEAHLDEATARFPAAHFVHVDDKASLLAATKACLHGRVTTVQVRQGHYAGDPPHGAPPDVVLQHITDLPAAVRARFAD
jgi:FMN phosphatase YigB (HAD superfamily)